MSSIDINYRHRFMSVYVCVQQHAKHSRRRNKSQDKTLIRSSLSIFK